MHISPQASIRPVSKHRRQADKLAPANPVSSFEKKVQSPQGDDKDEHEKEKERRRKNENSGKTGLIDIKA